jgi:hypothetical protein
VLNGTKVAGQKTHDFFGDGSLTLIDMPGVRNLGQLRSAMNLTPRPSIL